jgi:hypothetical protein
MAIYHTRIESRNAGMINLGGTEDQEKYSM